MIRLVSPADACATAEGRDLVSAVRRCQTRARMVVFVNQMFSAIAIGAAATLVWNIAWTPGGEGHWAVLAVSLVSALVAAVMLTYLRAPTLDATAAAIDRRLQLQDRIVAALQVCRELDPVSALVVRNAAARLGASTAADVFPMEFGRRAVTGTLLLTIAFLTLSIDLPGAGSQRPPRTGAGAVAMTGANGASVTTDRLNDAPVAATEPGARAVEPGNSRPPSGQDAASPRQVSAGDATERFRSPDDSAPEASPPAVSNAVEIRQRAAPTTVQSAGRVPAERGGEGSGSGGQSAAGATSRTAPGARAGAGGSAPDAGRASRGESGGVAAGRLDADASSETSPVTGGAEGAEGLVRAPGAARAQAGPAAMSRDDIPPALRQYVRDYFLRLQTPGTPR